MLRGEAPRPLDANDSGDCYVHPTPGKSTGQSYTRGQGRVVAVIEPDWQTVGIG